MKIQINDDNIFHKQISYTYDRLSTLLDKLILQINYTGILLNNINI